MSPRNVYFAIAACVVVGCVLRVSGLDVHSLWFDEAATVYVSSAPDLTEVLATDRHPPLFYWLLRVWMRAAGDSEIALRLLPALASCLALVVCASVCARRLDGARARLAAALLAVSPFSLWYAQELRAYSMLELSGALALAALAQATEPSARRWSACALAAASIALGVGSHYMAAVLLPGFFAVLVFAWRRGAIAPRRAVELCASACVGFAVWLPWLAAMLPRQMATSWTPLARMGWLDLAQFPVRLFLVELSRMPSSLHAWIWAISACVYAGLASTAWLERRARSSFAMYALLLGACGIATALVLASISRNFLPRYLAACAPAAVIGVAAGIGAWRMRGAAALASLVLLGGAIVLDVELRASNGKQDFRAACREVEARWRAGDCVLCVTGTAAGFNEAPARYYLRARPDIARTIVGETALPRLLADPNAPRRVHVVIYDAPFTREVYAALLAAGDVRAESASSFDVRYAEIELRRARD